jgi:signal transduction histidine kinase
VRMRDDFLSVAAHELKTPVTGLRGFAELALEQLAEEEAVDRRVVARSLRVIQQQSMKLARLVSQLLDVSRIEAGKLSLERSVTDVASLVESVAEAAQVGTARHTLVVSSAPSVPTWVDPLRIEQVVTNLIDNAIKYSPTGGQIDIEVVEPLAGTVRVAVRDRGVGIPPDSRQHIFDRYYRAHVQDHASGMGLGLYISREIVELHGGRIEVESPADGGTRFVVVLPANTTETTASSKETA